MRPIVVLLLLSALAPTAWGQQRAGAVYLFADGAPADLTADMTEVLISALTEDSDLTVLPKEKFLQRTQQVSDRYADQCLREADCVLKVGTGLNLGLVAIGFLQMQDSGYRLKITRYSLTGGDDRTFSFDALTDVPKLIQALKEVAKGLREAEGAVLVLTGDNAGATVFLDDKFIGVLPLKSIAMSEGFHKLLVRKKGFTDFRSKVSCKSGSRCEVPVALTPQAAGAAAAVVEAVAPEATGATEQAPTSSGFRPMRLVAGLGMGAGGALVGTGVYFLLRARSDSAWLDDHCDDVGASTQCSYPQRVLDEKTSDGKTSTTVGWALVGAGSAALVGCTAWLIYQYVADEPAAPSASLAPVVLPGYSGVAASFAF